LKDNTSVKKTIRQENQHTMNPAENICLSFTNDSILSASPMMKDVSKEQARYINHYLSNDTSNTMSLSKFHTIRDKIFEDAKNEKLQNTTSVQSSRASKMQRAKKYRSESALNIQEQPHQ
jgi:hypothetical protein